MVNIGVGRVWGREIARLNGWSSGRVFVLSLNLDALSDNPYWQHNTQNSTESSTKWPRLPAPTP
nr:MAG TPA: hypothetical protein [Caudoviricetes sp.]